MFGVNSIVDGGCGLFEASDSFGVLPQERCKYQLTSSCLKSFDCTAAHVVAKVKVLSLCPKSLRFAYQVCLLSHYV